MDKCDHRNGHRADKIMYRTKPDSVYVECDCGEIECIGTWTLMPPPSWDSEKWDDLIKSICMFLQYKYIDIYGKKR